jgi:hypothetical protein
MCDSGCDVTFTANKVTVTNGAAIFFTGTRDKDSGLWHVPLGNNNSEQAAMDYAQNVCSILKLPSTSWLKSIGRAAHDIRYWDVRIKRKEEERAGMGF